VPVVVNRDAQRARELVVEAEEPHHAQLARLGVDREQRGARGTGGVGELRQQEGARGVEVRRLGERAQQLGEILRPRARAALLVPRYR
jgi:hypothetical protein